MTPKFDMVINHVSKTLVTSLSCRAQPDRNDGWEDKRYKVTQSNFIQSGILDDLGSEVRRFDCCSVLRIRKHVQSTSLSAGTTGAINIGALVAFGWK